MAFHAAGAVATASSGNVTPALPASWAADDIHLCSITSFDNVAATMPAGWNAIDSGTNNGASLRTALFWRRAVGGDTDPVVTHTAGAAISAVIRGYRGRITSGDPQDATAIKSVNTPATATLTFGDITTVTDNCDIDLSGGIRNASGQFCSSYTGTPTPDERVDSGTQAAVVVADFVQTPAGSTGTRSCTISGTLRLNTGYVVALKPATGGGPVIPVLNPTLVGGFQNPRGGFING